MATLTSAIDATQRKIVITTPATPRPGARYRIGDELVMFSGFGSGTYREVEAGRYAWDPDETSWHVRRGVEGTVATSHDAGVTVTEFLVTAGGGSGITEGEHAVIDHTGIEGVGAGGGSDLLVDPGNVWEPETAYLVGDRILVDDEMVWESEDEDTSGTETPDWYSANTADDNNAITWRWLGNVGEVSYRALPLSLQDFADTTVTALHGYTDTGIAAHDVDVAAHAAGIDVLVAAESLLRAAATAGVGIGVDGDNPFVVRQMDGDPAYLSVLNGGIVLIGGVLGGPIRLDIGDLPTSDPLNEGQVWNSGGALMVSSGV